MRAFVVRLASAVVLVAWLLPAPAHATPSVEDQAYDLNRDGMIAMSEARFEEAIEAFERAAKLVADYDISGRPLMYTPVFMTGWGSEKIGRTREACAAYRHYLRIAVEHPVEPTKIDHANAYVTTNCQDSVPK